MIALRGPVAGLRGFRRREAYRSYVQGGKPPTRILIDSSKVTGSTTRTDLLRAVVLFAFLTVALLRLLGDYDVFFHMVVGREVLDRGHIPGEEFYILPRLGEASHHYEWGFGVLYYLVRSVAGVPGMVMTNALLGALTLS
jgi:hypothetical protein